MTAPSASVPLDNSRSLDVHLDDDLVVLSVPGSWEERLTREQAWLLMDALDLVATWGPGTSNATPTERPVRPSEPVPLHSEEDIRAARRTSYTGKAVAAFVLGFFLWIPGLIATVMFYNEAKRTEAIADQSLPGVGCLTAMFWLYMAGLALITLVVVAAVISA